MLLLNFKNTNDWRWCTVNHHSIDIIIIIPSATSLSSGSVTFIQWLPYSITYTTRIYHETMNQQHKKKLSQNCPLNSSITPLNSPLSPLNRRLRRVRSWMIIFFGPLLLFYYWTSECLVDISICLARLDSEWAWSKIQKKKKQKYITFCLGLLISSPYPSSYVKSFASYFCFVLVF